MSRIPESIGRYRVERLLGKGAMGAVYRAVGPDGEAVAVKVLTQGDAKGRRRFSREYEVGRTIVHPHVVRTLEVGEHEGDPYIVMELVTGSSLHALMEQRRPMGAEVVAHLVDQLAEGLHELHSRGITHRDIKPQNLMVAPGDVLKVMDLGLLKADDRTQLTATGALAGTPFYMAPEQLAGKPVTPAADLFAAAIVIFQLLTGRHPFRAKENPDLASYFDILVHEPPDPWSRARIGGPLDRFFAKALAPEPAARFPDARALAGALRRALAEQTQGSHPDAPTQDLGAAVAAPKASPPAPRPGPRRALALLGLAGALAAWLGLHLVPEPEVQVLGTELLDTPAGPVVLLRTATATRPVVPGGALLASADEGRLHACRLPPGTGSAEIRTAGGRPLWAREAAEQTGRPVKLVSESLDPAGRLLVRLETPDRVPVVLAVPGRGEVAARERAAGLTTFALDDPDGHGFPACEVVLALDSARVPWGRLSASPGFDDRLGVFVAHLGAVDPLAWISAAARAPDPGHDLLERVRKEGLGDELATLAPTLAARWGRRTTQGPEDAALLAGLSGLRFLDAYLQSLEMPSPLDCDAPGLAARFAPIEYARQEPAPGPGVIGFPYPKDFFSTDLARRAMIASPESILSQEFGTRPLGPVAPGVRGAWLGVHIRRVRGFAYRFYGQVTLNGHGPLFVLESPRNHAPLEHGDEGGNGGWFNRRYRLAVPAAWLGGDNQLRIEFKSWPRTFTGPSPDDEKVANESLRDTVPVQAVVLVPAAAE